LLDQVVFIDVSKLIINRAIPNMHCLSDFSEGGLSAFLQCRKAFRYSFIAGRRCAFPSLPEGAFGFSGLRVGWLYWVGRLQMPAMDCNVGLGLPALPGD